MGDEHDDALRLGAIQSLFDQGLETQWRERAYTSEAVNEVVARLQATSAKDLSVKLTIAGFTLKPYVSGDGDGDEEVVQACETCMYYVVHRKFCELPELMLPVRPEWSCRLWRI